MPRKALITALLAMILAAPQAQAGVPFSTTIVIRSVPAIRIAPQGGARHWQRPAHHPRALIRHQRHQFGHHPRWHAAAARGHWGSHHRPRPHMPYHDRHPGRH